MYFPQIPNPQTNGYPQQPMPQMYPQNPMYPIPHQQQPFQQPFPQQPVSPFMYPTKLQPYNDRQFLCKTFNFRVPFIEAFLSLSHQQKLKFFLICESRRLTGELTDKQTYSKVLEKITMIVNPNYKKPQQQQYKEISQEELKKKILEKEFEQKCEWELRKLGMGDQLGGGFGSPNSMKNNSGVNTNLYSNNQLGSPKGNRPMNEMGSMSGGLSMNFNEFDMLGSSSLGQKGQVKGMNSMNPQVTNNTYEQDEFEYQQAVAQSQVSNEWDFASDSTNNNKVFQENNILQNQFQSQSEQIQSTISQSQQIESTITSQSYNQPFQSQSKQQQQQQWQQAEQVMVQPTSNTTKTPPYNNYSQTEKPTSFTIITKPQQKVESIWDLQINEQQIKQSQPDIKQIFGIKSSEQDDFGGFEEANIDMMGNNSNSNVSSFFKQNQFRYETVAEVNNDWLLGGGNSNNTKNVSDYTMRNSANITDNNNSRQIDFIVTNEVVPQSNIEVTEPQWSFDNIQLQQQPQPITQNSISPTISHQPLLMTNTQTNPLSFDINQFDITSLIIPPQTQSQSLFNNTDNYPQPISNTPLDFNFVPQTVPAIPQQQQLYGFSMPQVNNSDISGFNEIQNTGQTQKQQEDEWDQGEEVVLESSPVQIIEQEKEHNFTQSPNKPQQIAIDFNFNTLPNQNQPFSFPITQPNTSSTNYDPFDTIELTTSQLPSISQPNHHVDSNLISDFSFTPHPEPTITTPAIPSLETCSPTTSQKQIKIIKKIIKPPSMKTIQIESSNFNHFNSLQNRQPPTHEQSLMSNLSSVVQPRAQIKPQLSSPPSYQAQMTQSNAFAKKTNLTAVNSLNLSIVPSMNIAVASSSNLPSPQAQRPFSQIPNSISASTYIPQKPTQQQPQQKIISTYNKQMTYTPDSFRSSIKSMLTKSKTFFKTFSRDNNSKKDSETQSVVEHYSMVDMDYGKNREFLTGSHKVQAIYSPKMSSRGFGKSSKGLDYSIDTHMMQDRDEFQGNQNNVDDMNDIQGLNENELRFNTTAFTKRSSSNKQPTNPLSGQDVIQSPVKSQNDIQHREERQKLLSTLSKSFILKLPQNEINYLNSQLKKNMFFFNRDFYIKMKQILQRLSLSQDLTHFFKSTSRSHPTVLASSQSSLFSTQVTFINQIIEKLQRIDELNKKFTLAMEDDQEEELAQVVMKSKQLTFEVNEDGQVAKRIVGLVLVGRVNDMSDKNDEQFDEETDKYYGLYYTFVKLILQRESQLYITAIPQQTLTHLTSIYNDASSCSLSSKSQFLYTCTILYILHTQLNQLQYIKNISQTIFGYLIKQHSILMGKIQQIKQLSSKYAESPHSIFGKLMEKTKMNDYLKGLGEMAMVAERLSELGKRIGVRFEKQEFSYDRLVRTITESRQLSMKYNLLSSTQNQNNNQTLYTPYLAVLLSAINSAKSNEQLQQEIRSLLKDKPVCKVCLTPRKQAGDSQGDFISNKVAVSSQSLRSQNSIEWCHYTCYNMLKMAFEDTRQTTIE